MTISQAQSDRRTRRAIQLAAAAALLLLRRPIIPVFRGDSGLDKLEALGADLEANLGKLVVIAQTTGAHLGYSSLVNSLPENVEVEASKDIAELRKLRAEKLAECFAGDWAKRVEKAEAAGSEAPSQEASKALQARVRTLLRSEAAR